MYKDKDKQREANRQAKRAQRARDNEPQGMTLADNVIPSSDIRVIPKRGKDIKCFEDLPMDVQETIDQMSLVDGKIDQSIKANRTAIAINYQHLFPGRYYSTGSGAERPWERDGQETFGKPGDADYNGCCTPEWRAERGR